MSLRPSRQIFEVNRDFCCPFTQENGGILTFASASGNCFVQYAHNGSGVHALGIQLFNIENIGCELPVRELETVCDCIRVATEGDFITDWVYPIGEIEVGSPAYVGPSGTFTNDASLGGELVGKFLGSLDPKPHLLTMRGLGYTRTYLDSVTNELVTENDPINRTLVFSPGFIKVSVEC